MSARAWPRPTPLHVEQRLADLLAAGAALIDSKTKAEQQRLSDVRDALRGVGASLEEARSTPVKDLVRDQKYGVKLWAHMGIDRRFRAARAPTDEAMLDRVVGLIETGLTLVDSRTKAGQAYFRRLRNGLLHAQDAVEWTRTTPLEEKIRRGKTIQRLLRPIMKPREDRWLREQLGGLAQEPTP
jgi:hypothetical protein